MTVRLGISDNVEFCDFGIDKSQRDQCYLNVAIRTHNPSISDKKTLSFWLIEEELFDWCYTLHDKENNNTPIEGHTLCAQSTPISYCKLKVAKDFDECDSFLEKDDERDFCYMGFVGIEDVSNPNYETYKSFDCNKFNTVIGKQFCEDSKIEEYSVGCCSGS